MTLAWRIATERAKKLGDLPQLSLSNDCRLYLTNVGYRG
jgi:hypothetical protein